MSKNGGGQAAGPAFNLAFQPVVVCCPITVQPVVDGVDRDGVPVDTLASAATGAAQYRYCDLRIGSTDTDLDTAAILVVEGRAAGRQDVPGNTIWAADMGMTVTSDPSEFGRALARRSRGRD